MENKNPDNTNFIRISGIDNPFEAQLLGSVLEERAIPHRIRSHHDTAYNGLYQMQKGWGEIHAPALYKSTILDIIEQIRNETDK
ncbi:MAG: hypothetical protein ACOC8I_00995 [Desulfosalsimonas sp.]